MSIFKKLSPEQEAKLELECRKADAWREADDARRWDEYCAKEEEKRYKAERAKMKAEGRFLTYDEYVIACEDARSEIRIKTMTPEEYEGKEMTKEEFLEMVDFFKDFPYFQDF